MKGNTTKLYVSATTTHHHHPLHLPGLYPGAVLVLTLCCTPSGCHLLHPGRHDTWPIHDRHLLSQVSSGAWLHPETTGAALPPPRFFHCGAAVGSQAFIFGGRAPVRTPKADLLNDLWCLDTVRALHVLWEGTGYQRSAEWRVHCPIKVIKELAMGYEKDPSGTSGQGLY